MGLFEHNNDPKISDEVLDIIEDFLLYESSEIVVNSYSQIINFTIPYMDSYINRSGNLSSTEENYLRRIIHIFRCFKPNQTPTNLCQILDNYVLKILNQVPSVADDIFRLLVERVFTEPGITLKLDELLFTAIRKTQFYTENIEQLDYPFQMAILESFYQLFSLKKQQPMLEFFSIHFLQLASQVLDLQNTQKFNRNMMRLISKALRATSRMIEAVSSNNPNESLRFSPRYSEVIRNIITKIPQDTNFTSIYLNILLLCSTVSNQQEQIIASYYYSEMMKNTFGICFPVFQESKRVYNLLSFFGRCISNKAIILSANDLQEILAMSTTILSSISSLYNFSSRMSSLLSPTIFDKFLIANNFSFSIIINQILSCFEILALDYHTKKESYSQQLFINKNQLIFDALNPYIILLKKPIQLNPIFYYYVLAELSNKLSCHINFLFSLPEKVNKKNYK